MQNTEPIDSTQQNTQCIQQQCGVSYKKASELLTRCNGDIVLAISSHFDASVLEDLEDKTKSTEPTDPTQQALNTIRNIANEKDAIMNKRLEQQKQLKQKQTETIETDETSEMQSTNTEASS